MGTTIRGYIGIMGYILRLYRDNGKENGFLMIWVVVKIMVPFLGPYCSTALNVWGTQKGTIILTTSHMSYSLN